MMSPLLAALAAVAGLLPRAGVAAAGRPRVAAAAAVAVPVAVSHWGLLGAQGEEAQAGGGSCA
eukprot:5618504-Pyramimonas_sp.AAC.1